MHYPVYCYDFLTLHVQIFSYALCFQTLSIQVLPLRQGSPISSLRTATQFVKNSPLGPHLCVHILKRWWWEGELNQIYCYYLQTKITLKVQLKCGKAIGCIKLSKTIRMVFFDCVLPFKIDELHTRGADKSLA